MDNNNKNQESYLPGTGYDIAKKTRGSVWAMLRDEEEVQLLHLID